MIIKWAKTWKMNLQTLTRSCISFKYMHTHDHSFATILICKMAYPRIVINISHHYDIIKRTFSYIIINSTFVRKMYQKPKKSWSHSVYIIINKEGNTIRKFFWNCPWFLGCLSNCTNVVCLQNKRIIKCE